VIYLNKFFRIVGPIIFVEGPGLKFSDQATCRSSGARAWNAPQPYGVAAHAGEHRCGDGVRVRLCFLALMMLRRVAGSRPCSRCRRFRVIRRCVSPFTGCCRRALPDRLIGFQRSVLLVGCPLMARLQRSALQPQPLAGPSYQWRILRSQALD
jgi:hypothetical protein